MSDSFRLGLRDGRQVEGAAGGEVYLVSGDQRRLVGSPALAALLCKLAAGPRSLDELTAPGQAGDPLLMAQLLHLVSRLDAGGLLQRSVVSDTRTLAVLHPAGPLPPYEEAAVRGGYAYRLHRWAWLRREGQAAVLETALAPARVELRDPAAIGLGALLASGTTLEAACDQLPGLRPGAARLLLALFTQAGMLESVDGTPDPPPPTWEFHDLLFHTRSRLGRHDRPSGGTCRFAGEMAPPPVIRPLPEGETLDLPRPDLRLREHTDPPFAAVVEARRSHRVQGESAITVEQLSEFLYRTARVRHVLPGSDPQLSSRPYPGGGGLYELELYPVVARCQGLEPGLHHYDPLGHRLTRLAAAPELSSALLRGAAGAAHLKADPQVLIIIAARFGRVAWKYESMAYSLLLKNVGVLYQTMYLTATAMNLAACALGGGDSDLFARATGNNYYEETSVGEFILGSLGAPEAPEA